MAKPTLLQSILGRPSQSYHFPQQKEYFSNKQDLVRAATETTSSDPRPQSSPALRPASDSSQNTSSFVTASPTSSGASSPRRRRSVQEPEHVSRNFRRDSSTNRHSQSRHFTQSIASSHSNTDHQPELGFSTSSPSTLPTSLSSDHTPKPSPLPSVHRHSVVFEDRSVRSISAKGHEGDNEDSLREEESTDDDDDIFYTPRSSVYSSPRTSRSSAAMLIDPRALTYALLPLPSSPLHKSKPSLDGLSSHEQEADSSSVSRTSSESSFTSSSSSSSADSAVRSYVASTSSSRATTSTRITSPVTSDYGQNLANQVETITIASSHSRSQSDPQPSIRGQPRPLAATSTRRRRSQAEIRKETYTDEDWAKDVRWLAPNTPAQSESPHPLPPDFILPTDIPPASPTGTSSRLLQQQLRGPASYPPPAKSAEHRKRTRRSRGSRSSRGRMSALLEEDESEYSDATASASSAEPSRAPSPVQEEPPEVKEIASASSPLAASVTRSRSRRSTKERSSSDEGSENPDARLLAYARSNGHPRRSYSNTRPLSRATDSSAHSQTLPTHAIPNPTTSGESASIVHGYSSLTLPRAGYTGDGKAAVADGKIDLVRAGIAQSSMATVEVTRGVAQQRPTTDVRRKRRTFSFSLSLKFDLKGLKGKGREARTPAHLLDVLPLPVEFTAHLPPPSYVPSQHVLMQVFAVGLDALDSILVQEKVASGAKGAGFIPGRSVVGKVIEVGWEVKGDVCKRGDWVVGLLDVRKSGALAEFIVVERHRVHRVPQPLSRPSTLFPTNRSHVRSMSLPSQLNRHPYSKIHRDLLASTSMTLEELVLLPLCGVPAHRAIRTLADVISPSKTRLNVEDSHRRQPRVFIIQAHDGPGAMAVQMLARRGVSVCVQVPDSAARDDTNEGDDEDTDTPVTVRRSPSSSTKAKQTRYDRLEARLRAWGADEICVGEPLEVLEKMIEDGRSFDGVLDTVGGVEIWERSRKILLADPELDPSLQSSPLSPSTPTTPGTISSSGNSHSSRASSNSNKRGFTMTQFTTLVGDTPSRPIPTAHDNLRSGFRSFGRSSSTGSRSRSRSPTRSPAKSSASVLSSPSKDSLGPLLRRNTLARVKTQKRTVSYAWVCAAADVDFEGEDVRDSLGALISMVEQGWIRPWVGDSREGSKVVPFDQAPEAFRRHGDETVGLLKDGGTCIVKVVS